jgi:hypothetical protein
MTDIEKDVLKVIAYFSFFGYPVTAFEIWKWQFQPSDYYSLDEIFEALDSSQWLSERIQKKDGHFALGDIKSQLKTRHRHYLQAVKKYKKLQTVLNYVARVPGIEAVAICNSLPFHFTRAESDIDLFVVTEDGKLWSSRFMAVLPMLLLRQRPGEVKKSPVDMSFFVAKSALGLKEFRLKDKDPYFSFWTRSLLPVYEKHPGFFHIFQKENAWAQRDLPNSTPSNRPASFRRRYSGSLPAFISETFAQKISKRRLPKSLLEQANTDTCVVITEKVLKFHVKDRRKEIAEHLDLCLEKNS